MCGALAERCGLIRPGSKVEIGQFGRLCYWTGNDPNTMEVHSLESHEYEGRTVYYPVTSDGVCHVGIQWDWPRHIHEVVVVYADDKQITDASRVKVQ